MGSAPSRASTTGCIRKRHGRSRSHSTTPTAPTCHIARSAFRTHAPSARRRTASCSSTSRIRTSRRSAASKSAATQQPHHRPDADLRRTRPQHPRIRQGRRVPLGRLRDHLLPGVRERRRRQRTTASCTSATSTQAHGTSSTTALPASTCTTARLLAGDPISSNVFMLFSGFDDDESPIENHWQDGQINLGTDHLKVAHHMRVTGLIQNDQDIKVSLRPRRWHAGRGLHHRRRWRLCRPRYQRDDRQLDHRLTSRRWWRRGDRASVSMSRSQSTLRQFQHVSARFEALAIGHAAINSYTYKDVRDKGTRSLPTKTV